MFLNPFKNIAFSKAWFNQFQQLFLYLLNNKRLNVRYYFRDKLGCIQHEVGVPIYKITPNSVHYVIDNQIEATFYSYDKIANNFRREFENIFKWFHEFDIRIANRFVPILNFGYDTLTQYSSTSDGYLTTGNQSSWATCYSLTSGTVAGTTSTYTSALDAGYLSGSYSIRRPFFFFDTSSIGVGSTITDGTFSVYGRSNTAGKSTCVQKGTQSDPLVSGNMKAFSGSMYYNNTSWSTTSYNDYPLNATGLSDIVKDGVTKYCLRNYDRDYLNTTPTEQNVCTLYFADNTGYTNDPKLVVTYTTGATVTAKSYIY